MMKTGKQQINKTPLLLLNKYLQIAHDKQTKKNQRYMHKLAFFSRSTNSPIKAGIRFNEYI